MAIVASAPGKVLMTGGYLILERPNPGLVLSTNARFYAIIKPLHHQLQPNSLLWSWTDVKLTSPQLSRESMYKLALQNLTIQPVSPSEARNPFVEYAVQYSVAAAYATFDDNKKELLHKLLLQSNIIFLSPFSESKTTSKSNFIAGLISQVWTSQYWVAMIFIHTGMRYRHISCLSDSNRYHVIATSSSNVVKYLSTVCELVKTVKVPIQSLIYDHVLSSELIDDLRLSCESPSCGRCESHGGQCGFNFNTTNSSTLEIGCSNSPSKGISERVSYIIAICIWVPILLFLIAIFSWICNRFKLVGQGWAWRVERVPDFEPLISPQHTTTILGLDRPTIESYPKIVIDETQLLLKPNGEACPICLCEYRPKETVKRIPECRHCFHAQCIDEWLPLNASCPICRTSPNMLPQPLDPL